MATEKEFTLMLFRGAPYDLAPEYFATKACLDMNTLGGPFPKERAQIDSPVFNLRIERAKFRSNEDFMKQVERKAAQIQKLFEKEYKELEQHELNFRSRILQTQNYVVRNALKRERTKKLFEVNHANLIKHTENIKKKQKEVDMLKTAISQFDDALKKYSIYENFLEQFVQEYKPDFLVIQDVINRYGELLRTKDIVGEIHRKTVLDVLARQNVYEGYIRSHRSSLLRLRQSLPVITKKYEEVLLKTASKEKFVEDILVCISSTVNKLDRAIHGTNNIYQDITLRDRLLGIKTRKAEDILGQHLCIKEKLGRLIELNKRLMEKSTKKITSRRAQTSIAATKHTTQRFVGLKRRPKTTVDAAPTRISSSVQYILENLKETDKIQPRIRILHKGKELPQSTTTGSSSSTLTIDKRMQFRTGPTIPISSALKDVHPEADRGKDITYEEISMIDTIDKSTAATLAVQPAKKKETKLVTTPRSSPSTKKINAVKSITFGSTPKIVSSSILSKKKEDSTGSYFRYVFNTLSAEKSHADLSKLEWDQKFSQFEKQLAAKQHRHGQASLSSLSASSSRMMQ